MKFARELTEEVKRSVSGGLTEEELALFAILAKTEPALINVEVAAAKCVCRELLESLKREKQQARAAVMQTLKVQMRTLPATFTKDIREEKLARAYANVYDHYFGPDQNAYGF